MYLQNLLIQNIGRYIIIFFIVYYLYSDNAPRKEGGIWLKTTKPHGSGEPRPWGLG